MRLLAPPGLTEIRDTILASRDDLVFSARRLESFLDIDVAPFYHRRLGSVICEATAVGWRSEDEMKTLERTKKNPGICGEQAGSKDTR